MENIHKIKNTASALVSECKLSGVFPVPLAAIVTKLGYEINIFKPNSKTENISGAICRNRHLILVNGKDHYLRQRFTIAHEIGHLKLHPNEEEIIDYRKINEADEKELEANEFAACLLMPEEDFIKKYEYFEGNISYLSHYFGASAPSIGLRIVRLGIDR